MSRKTMLINATDPEEIRVATLQDGILYDYDVEFIHNEKIKGNIYKARVVRVDTALQAAFVHYGGTKNGFLPLGELPRDMVSPDGRRGRIQDLLHKDQEIMVQAVREELGSKGAMMTAQLSLAGRFLVITPGNSVNGISRKIEGQDERKHFKKLIDELDIPKDTGVIVRTASMGVTKEDFQRDLEFLLDSWKEVNTRFKHRNGAGLVWQEDDVVTRTLRDSWSPDIEEVHIDDLDTFHEAQSFFRRTMPKHVDAIRHYTGKKPLFSKFQTEEQIDRVYGRKVPLPSGGALVLDQTEALVAIDVNSGKTSGDNQEDTAYKTNLEAAEEVARQLRLRDLAGLVVIDFIDMRKESHNKAVQDRLVEGLKADKARMEVGKINRFGVLVMTRQRIRPSLEHVTHESCPMCQGSGKVKSLEALVLSVVRRIKAITAKGDVKRVSVRLAPAIATEVLNAKRRDLAEVEERGEVELKIIPDYAVAYGDMQAEIERREEEREPKAEAHAKPHEPRRKREDETVVLGGDSPISFEKALAEPKSDSGKGGFGYDQRDLQRAALEERERLRSLFESAKPEDEEEEGDEAEGEDDAKAEGGRKRRRRRRRRGRGGDRAEGSASETLADAQPARPVESAPEPPKLSGDVIASLTAPAARPKKLGADKAAAPAEPAAEAPAPKKRAAKKAVKAETAADEAPKPKAPRAKKAAAAGDEAEVKPKKRATKAKKSEA
ncbi:MAG: Rne/Rng family ribonuclease [Acidobacteria bacterium]|nr:Rne/Rng family ribonuclease [Acidobacteriota bacterium]